MGTPVLSLAAVSGFDYDQTAFKRTSLPTAAGAWYWLKPGDLLVTRSNTPTLVGHAAIYSGFPAPCIYPDLMMRLELDDSRADTQFTWLWLQTMRSRDYLMREAKGTSPSMKKVSQRVLCNLPFPVELGVDQQRILAQRATQKRNAAFEMLELHQKSVGSLSRLVASILHRAFSGDL